MIRALGLLATLADAAPAWDDARGPRSSRYGDSYHGSDDAVGESRHAFIDGSDLATRLAGSVNRRFTIAELGFGSGLNFLLSWQAARAAGGARLQYLGIDRHPLRREELARALQRFPALAPLASALGDALPPPVAGIHRCSFDDGRILLDLYWADVGEALAELDSLATPLVEAWYLDGFAPSRNPAMWTPAVFQAMARCSRDRATVATYSAAGQVRRDLASAGFDMQRHPGFGNKRECLRGSLRERPPTASTALTPWDLPDSATGADPLPLLPRGDRRAIVIGAGLAGAHAAAALARRDFQVTVLDATDVAGRASGNPQGLLFTRLSHQRSTLGDFSLAAFRFAAHLYEHLFATGRLRRAVDGDLSGCFQFAHGDSGAIARALAELPELALVEGADTATRRLGARVATAGFWQPGSGWLSPPAVCRALLAQPRIAVLDNCGPLRLIRDDHLGWVAVDADDRCRAAAPVAVIAGGSGGRDLIPGGGLPLRAVRGQTTQLPAPPGLTLAHALCHRGYIAPAVNGMHCIGATFRPGDESRALRASEHAENLAMLADALPDWRDHLAALDPESLDGRAELRCVSPDYLPLAGPVPDVPAFRARYAPLARDARTVVAARGPVCPGLWISTAHGSRGLSYAALAAELIASAICGEAPPLPRELARAVSPARFAIRAIVRGERVEEPS